MLACEILRDDPLGAFSGQVKFGQIIREHGLSLVLLKEGVPLSQSVILITSTLNNLEGNQNQ